MDNLLNNGTRRNSSLQSTSGCLFTSGVAWRDEFRLVHFHFPKFPKQTLLVNILFRLEPVDQGLERRLLRVRCGDALRFLHFIRRAGEVARRGFQA